VTTRRDFLRAIGTGTLGLGALPELLRADGHEELVRKIGMQLYTVREEAKANLLMTLARIARIGYREVEFAGYFGNDLKQIKATLDQNHLVAPSAHYSLEDLRKDFSKTIDQAAALGHSYLIFAWVPKEERTPDGYRAIADDLNRGGALAASHGMKVGYHNYSYDFDLVGRERPYDLLLARTDPNTVAMEMDIYWIISGGGDPLEYFAKYPGRFELLHIKDMLGDAKHTIVDVGDGIVNWRKVISRAKAQGAKHFFVEHDETKDPFRTLRRSFTYLRGLRS
jgi:sugar phosphate isomerase/epimerase